MFVSEEDVQAFYTCLQVHVEKIAAAGCSPSQETGDQL